MQTIMQNIRVLCRGLDTEKVRAFFESLLKEDNWWNCPDFERNEVGFYKTLHLNDKYSWFLRGYRSAHAHQEERYRETLLAAKRYIVHVGMNETMKGGEHPQQLLLDQINQALGENSDD